MDTLSAYHENPSGCRSPFRNRYAFNSGLIILGFSIGSHLVLYLQKTLTIASRLSDCLSPQFSPFEVGLLNAEFFCGNLVSIPLLFRSTLLLLHFYYRLIVMSDIPIKKFHSSGRSRGRLTRVGPNLIKLAILSWQLSDIEKKLDRGGTGEH